MEEVSQDVLMELGLGRMSAEFARAPQPFYARVLREAPVMVAEGAVTVSRHDDVLDVLQHPEIFTSDWGEGVGLGNDGPLIPLQIDPPKHKGYRKLLDPLFAPRKMAALEADVVALTDEIIDGFADRGECEFNGEFAVPLPTTVFLKLLGLPIEDRPLFLDFKDGIIRPPGEPETHDAHRQKTAQQMYAYFNRVLDERQTTPADDLLTGFLHSEVEGTQLNRDEILGICFLLLIAGLDTVTDALDCSFAFLAQHPDHRRQIVDDPELIPSAIEELLRWETVVPGVARFAKIDTEIRGCPVSAGDAVSVSVGAANCDPEVWERPDEVDLARSPNRHLAFGGGVHRCLGSHLARLELRTAFSRWHARIPDYQLADGVELEYTPGLRQVEHLPLVFSS